MYHTITNKVKSTDVKRNNGMLKVCYVPATSATFLAYFLFFLMWQLTVLMKLTMQAVHAVEESIFLRCMVKSEFVKFLSLMNVLV
jgi:hypothetical protein